MADLNDRLHRGDGELGYDDAELEDEQRSRSHRQRASNSGREAEVNALRAHRQRGQYLQTGRASWYGERFAGQAMANGEPFDPEAMTCAHRSLPLGTRIEVTLLDHPFNRHRQLHADQSSKVEVTVTDRGPFVAERILDLSRKAADTLGAIDAGEFMVGIKRL